MSKVQPFFVFGALRSGTTVLRLMLTHHNSISSPGEADFLFDYISEQDGAWRYDLDALTRDRIFRAKDVGLPDMDGVALTHALVEGMAAKQPDKAFMSLSVHRHASKMSAFFPDAKIIHLVRDPRDVARSSIGMGWTGNSYFGIDHWIETERSWEAANIDDTRVLQVHFEDLMSDLEAELSRICSFLGLEFDHAMLDYHKYSTYDPPDPSISQKWRQKAGTREIALIEGRCGRLLERCGYEVSQAPAQPTASELLGLKIENRTKRWKYNVRRYGFPLFAGHHAARLFGLKGIARKLAERQEAIQIARLK